MNLMCFSCFEFISGTESEDWHLSYFLDNFQPLPFLIFLYPVFFILSGTREVFQIFSLHFPNFSILFSFIYISYLLFSLCCFLVISSNVPSSSHILSARSNMLFCFLHFYFKSFLISIPCLEV